MGGLHLFIKRDLIFRMIVTLVKLEESAAQKFSQINLSIIQSKMIALINQITFKSKKIVFK